MAPEWAAPSPAEAANTSCLPVFMPMSAPPPAKTSINCAGDVVYTDIACVSVEVEPTGLPADKALTDNPFRLRAAGGRRAGPLPDDELVAGSVCADGRVEDLPVGPWEDFSITVGAAGAASLGSV